MNRTIIKPRAQSDLSQTYHWYNKKYPGIGDKFLDLFSLSAKKIEKYPKLYPVVYRGVRRVVMNHFPYQIFYKYETNNELIKILAVLHQRQNFKKQLKERLE